MGKIKRILLLLVAAVFFQINTVNAASKCDYNEQVELNNAAANIKASYEEAEKSTGKFVLQADGTNAEIKYKYFKISVYNLSEDVYVKITNDYNNEVKTITYAQTESGVGVYEWTNLNDVTTFKITVYSSSNTICPNEEYRIINLTTPRYNSYSDLAYCNGNEDFYLCQKYITETEEINLATFTNKLESFEKKREIEEEKNAEAKKNIDDKIIEFIKEYKVPIIIVSTVIVVSGVVAIVIVIRKRRSRLI